MATTDWVVICLLDCVVFSRATRAACARYVLDDSSIATYLAALGGGELGGSKSEQAIVVCGGWSDTSAVNTELEKRWQHGVVGQVSFCDWNSTVATSERENTGVVFTVEGAALSDKVA